MDRFWSYAIRWCPGSHRIHGRIGSRAERQLHVGIRPFLSVELDCFHPGLLLLQRIRDAFAAKFEA